MTWAAWMLGYLLAGMAWSWAVDRHGDSPDSTRSGPLRWLEYAFTVVGWLPMLTWIAVTWRKR